eukprot:CAMPEP_0173384422 /NCGR_PEP_ID=MMETSP1356-20130122/6986_1 /TAXON_ID=77927 ORGANISM="Hemiselmis virescens, Strain PCC157" /NCGR_SAMPLE_ID=MMETSP1356 /ASSEMBLY_ACC=CAM_ASM_000847 /LENGTH=77 /DNA_ID=CAMNT_0014339761 /DNA_START=232 /DNA_END=465 /DNA_ORIENTATION=-
MTVRKAIVHASASFGRAFQKFNVAPAAVASGRRDYKHNKLTKPWNPRAERAHQKQEQRQPFDYERNLRVFAGLSAAK